MAFSAGDVLQNMNASQQAGMVNQMLALNTTGNGSSLAGGLVARGGALAGGMIPSLVSMAGYDPMSLGIRAGTFAFNRGMGLMGAGAMGMGMMATTGLIGAGVSATAAQMMQGAQEQLALNRGLAQNFNFMNAQGGMGFTSTQGHQIGDIVRSSAGIIGQSGEVATFGELSKLASNMGRMGMAQNVRTVQEFKTKFKEMVDTLKTVAHDLGTSLEEAQKMMVSMKSSGIFNKFDQIKMSHGMRAGALAGGIAMSEMSSAASIGSQISRSIGGLGRQGAFAGMKTMEQIGISQRIGAISEEDIYNATGLTGAEGRQALAASQMQQSASFLQSGRGRRFLASIAGQNGTLNMDAVNEWLAGGNMSTGRTMELAQKNLSGVGRANFIRNEGRLRGAALEKFGGLAQSLVYKQWLSERGYTPDDMDDTSMLAFQRFTGMGRDEADLAVKQIQKLPEMARAMRDTESNLQYSDMRSRQLNTSGLAKIKMRFEQKKEHIQDVIQKQGARLLEYGTDVVERWANDYMDVYTSHVTEGIQEIASSMERGGPQAKADYNRYFSSNVGGAAGTRLIGGSGVGALGATDPGFNAYNRNRNMLIAATSGSFDQEAVGFGMKNAAFMRMSGIGSAGKSPEEILKAFSADLSKASSTSEQMKKLAERFQQSTELQQIALLRSAQQGARMSEEQQIGADIQRQGVSFTPGGTSKETEADYNDRIGRRLLGLGENRSYKGKWEESGSVARGAGHLAATASLLGGGLVATARYGAMAFKDVTNFFARGFNLPKLYESSETTSQILQEAGDNAAWLGTETAAATQNLLDRFTGVSEENKGAAQAASDKVTKGLLADLFTEGQESKGGLAILDQIRTMSGKGEKQTHIEKGSVKFLSAAYVAAGHMKDIAEYQDNVKQGKNATPEQAQTQKKMVEQYRQLTGEDASKVLTPEEQDVYMNKILVGGRDGIQVLREKNQKDLESDRMRIITKMGEEQKVGAASGRLVQKEDGSYEIKEDFALKRASSGMSKEAMEAAALADKLVTQNMDEKVGEGDMEDFKRFLKESGKTDAEYNKDQAGVSKEFRHWQYYDRSAKARQKFAGLSVEDKKKLIAEGGKSAEFAGEAQASEERFTDLAKRMGGEGGAIAGLLGIRLTKEQQQLLGKGSVSDIGEILGKAGIADADLQTKLAEAISDKDPTGKVRTAGDKAKALEDVMSTMDPKTREKIETNKGRDEDKNFKALDDIRRNLSKDGHLASTMRNVHIVLGQVRDKLPANPEKP